MATPEEANAIPEHPLEQEPWIAYALTRIRLDYGHICIANRLDVNKFGKNTSVGPSEVSINSWNADEAYQSSNIFLNLSSTSILDAGKELKIAYATLELGEFIFGVMTVELDAVDGRIAVQLPVAAARWTRMLSSYDQMVGDVSIFRGASINGVPSVASSIHNQIPAGERVSENTATTVTNRSYGILLNFWAGVIEKNDTAAIIKFKVREFGADFLTITAQGVSSGSGLDHNYKSPIIIPEGSDILMTAKATGIGTEITAGYSIVLADIVGEVAGFGE